MFQVKKWLSLSLIALSIGFSGCEKDPEPVVTPTPVPVTPDAFSSGVFVTCEGGFNSGTGSVSFYNRSSKAVINNLFNSVNNKDLGNIVQSMSVHNGKSYIVVNNSNKVEVVNAGDFKAAGTISKGLNLPRYFLGIDAGKGYVTEWGSGFSGSVKVINLNTNTVIDSIVTGKGPERMIKVGNFVYVTCKGGFGNENVVTVINSFTNTVFATITVGANPDGIEVDANGKIWVLCGGQWNIDYSALAKSGSLVRIDPLSNTVEQTFNFSSTASMSLNLSINGAKNKLFYTYLGKVYSQDIAATALSTAPFINRDFYGLGVDPVNDDIYGSDAGNFNSPGYVLRYNNAAARIDSFGVGVVPGGFYFRNEN